MINQNVQSRESESSNGFFFFTKKSQETDSSEVIQCDPSCVWCYRNFQCLGFNSKFKGKNTSLL